MFVGALIAVSILAYIYGEPASSLLYSKPYLSSYVQMIGLGFPLMASLVCGDDPRLYGLRREGLAKSMALSAAPALALRVLWGIPPSVKGYGLAFPFNILYALLAVAAYGPLEVFFAVWLIVNTDKVIKTGRRTLSPGLLATTLTFGLIHLVTAPRGGLPNAVTVAIEFTALGLVFKYSGNSVGPMAAWTLINGQVIRLLLGSLA